MIQCVCGCVGKRYENILHFIFLRTIISTIRPEKHAQFYQPLNHTFLHVFSYLNWKTKTKMVNICYFNLINSIIQNYFFGILVSVFRVRVFFIGILVSRFCRLAFWIRNLFVFFSTFRLRDFFFRNFVFRRFFDILHMNQMMPPFKRRWRRHHPRGRLRIELIHAQPPLRQMSAD